MGNHINVSLCFADDNKTYDLRVPTQLTVQQFIKTVGSALKRKDLINQYSRIRVANKALVLFDTQRLQDFPITNGDEIEIF